MAKEELIEFEGVIVEMLPEGRFRVKLENDHEVLAYTAGKMKKHRIRSLVGDRVTVEMTPDDLSLQLREGCLAVRQAQAQCLDTWLRIELEREHLLRIRLDRSVANCQTEFDLHSQSPSKQGSRILCRCSGYLCLCLSL